ncbi:MAG: hybrid sensor histidine kinase/response regulator [Proteobacteria bacterium]|nr:hybrid sensor histidine kinase/response regulator [Pseudomonadota bacterium]MBU1058438.1 hybrid sensor histidine kinase/response regulator [Pseudomonadota bacterium]
MTGTDNDLSSMSMMDLFRQEADNHCAALSDNLLALEKNSADAEALTSLMRAAHSIKGAARIMNLDTIVGLAHAMEDIFVAAQEDRVEIGTKDIDLLFKCVDKIEQLGHVQNDDVLDWLAGEKEAIKRLVCDFSQLVTRGKEEKSPLDKAPPQEASVPVAKVKTENAMDLSSMSMMDLFRQEADNNCLILSDNLLALEKTPGDSEVLAALMRAAHSIKGAARVINLQSIVGLAHTMEDVFVAAQEGKIILGRDHVDVLLNGTDLFAAIAKQPDEQLDTWFKEQEKPIKDLENIFKEMAAGKALGAVPQALAKPQQISVKKKKSAELAETGKPADRSMRVSADGMNRLMGFAGEVQVESRWLPSLSRKVLRFKHQQDEVYRLLGKSVDAFGSGLLEDFSINDFRTMTAKMNACRSHLNEILEEIEDHARRSTEISHHLYEEVLANRMRPFADGITGFPRMVRDVGRELGKNVEFKIIGEDTLVDRDILDKIEAPLNHLIRNAIDHGIEPPQKRIEARKPETALIRLEAKHSAGMLSITVSDDGCGIDIEKLRDTVIGKKMLGEETAHQLREMELLEFIFLPNFSTRNVADKVSGRGVGLDVVHSAVQEVRGIIRISTKLGFGTTFEMQLPLTLSVMRSLLVTISNEIYAFPLAAIDHVIRLQRDAVREIEGRQYISFNQERVGLVSATQVLEKEEKKDLQDENDDLLILVISDHYHRYGLIVDAFIEIRDLVVQPLDSRLKKVQDISSVAILEDGTPVLIVDVEDMIRTIDSLILGNRLRRINREDFFIERAMKRILVVDDSITVREVERNMLFVRGYDVTTAVDGLDGWNTLRSQEFDLVITDVDMPRMNGIELVTLMRQNEKFATLPVIIVSYKDRKEDRDRGLEAGADYYLTKGSFQDETLVRAVEDLIGVPSKKL